jgi:hypothetical protein
VDWCGTNTMKWLQGENESALPPPPKVMKEGPTAEKKYDDNEPHCHPPNLGDVVAVPFVDNDTEEPSFWLGKCLRVNMEDSTLLLGWFQEVDKGRYKMKIGASWPEVSLLLLLFLSLSLYHMHLDNVCHLSSLYHHYPLALLPFSTTFSSLLSSHTLIS